MALGGGDASGMHGEGPTQGCGGTRGAHVEHAVHGRDAGGVPIGNVRVEILQVFEEVAAQNFEAEQNAEQNAEQLGHALRRT